MKLSDLIVELRNKMAMYGDIEVAVHATYEAKQCEDCVTIDKPLTFERYEEDYIVIHIELE